MGRLNPGVGGRQDGKLDRRNGFFRQAPSMPELLLVVKRSLELRKSFLHSCAQRGLPFGQQSNRHLLVRDRLCRVARNVPKLDRRIPYVKPRDFGTIQ